LGIDFPEDGFVGGHWLAWSRRREGFVKRCYRTVRLHREKGADSAVGQAVQGSFDSALTSLHEVSATLRMTILVKIRI